MEYWGIVEIKINHSSFYSRSYSNPISAISGPQPHNRVFKVLTDKINVSFIPTTLNYFWHNKRLQNSGGNWLSMISLTLLFCFTNGNVMLESKSMWKKERTVFIGRFLMGLWHFDFSLDYQIGMYFVWKIILIYCEKNKQFYWSRKNFWKLNT